jgi:hypothetical protein
VFLGSSKEEKENRERKKTKLRKISFLTAIFRTVYCWRKKLHAED